MNIRTIKTRGKNGILSAFECALDMPDDTLIIHLKPDNTIFELRVYGTINSLINIREDVKKTMRRNGRVGVSIHTINEAVNKRISNRPKDRKKILSRFKSSSKHLW